MKKIMIIASLLAVACNDIEPIDIEAPKREINTQALTQYKADLNKQSLWECSTIGEKKQVLS